MKRLNNRGSALLTAMISALSVGVVSAIILQQSQVTEKQTRLPRIKSAMMMVETQLREALDTGVFLKDCDPPNRAIASCKQIDLDKLRTYSQIMPGASCPTAAPCGVEIATQNFDPVSGVFTASIVYTGQEVSVAPVNISMTANTNELWQSLNSNCDPSTPLLTGFDQAGNKICKALPLSCGSGSYIRSIDPMSLTSGGVECEPFPANITCAPGQFINTFSWIGGGRFNHNCAALLNPFSPAALNDPTSYSYASASPPSVSSWPTTTIVTTTTTTTTTLPPTTTTVPPTLPPITYSTSSCNFTYRLPVATPFPWYAGQTITVDDKSQWTVSWRWRAGTPGVVEGPWSATNCTTAVDQFSCRYPACQGGAPGLDFVVEAIMTYLPTSQQTSRMWRCRCENRGL